MQATLEKLRKDFRFLSFYHLPRLEGFRDEPSWYAEALGLSPERAEAYRAELLDSGLWTKGEQGIRRRDTHLGLGAAGEDLSASEFLAMMGQLLSRISSDGPCWYEVKHVVTSHEHKREFLGQVSGLIKSFLEKAKTQKGETLVSWAHVSLNSLRAIKEENEV